MDIINSFYEKLADAEDRGDYTAVAHYEQLIKNAEKAERMKNVKIARTLEADPHRARFDMDDKPWGA